MSAALIDATNLFWAGSEQDERRFRRILLRVAALFTVLSVVVPWLPVPDLLQQTLPPPPLPQARLILPIKPPPPVLAPQIKPTPRITQSVPRQAVKPMPAKPLKTVVAAVPQPAQDAHAARARALRSGVLAFKDALADLRDQPITTSVNTKTRRSAAGGTASSVERSLITSDLARGSGGINTAALSRDTGGGALAGRSTTRVRSALNAGGGGATASADGAGRLAGRSAEEIQTIFDRNKGAIYAIYNRALRSDPTLQGKVVLRLTITPSGRVSICRIVSSDLHATELESKLTGRVLLFDFGAKDVGELTITYPLDFLPA